MIIESVSAQTESHELVSTFHGSNYIYTHKNLMTVKAKTNTGIAGYCYLGDDFLLGDKVIQLFNQSIAPVLIGRNPLKTYEIWDDLRPQARGILSDRRIALHAQALADAVCWDIVGKAAGKPLIQVLGLEKQHLPIIAIAGYYSPKKDLAGLTRETHNLIELGFRGIKLKVGGASLDEDIKRVKTVRKAGGASFLLAVDANQAWSLSEAKYFLNSTITEDLLWVEEPVHWDNDIADLIELKKNTKVKLCAGQSECSVAGLKRLIDSDAVDICNLHPTYCGGITPWLEGAQHATKNGLFITNTGEPQLSCTLMLAFANSICIEMYHPDRDPIFPIYCPVSEKIKDGYLSSSSSLGWGIMPEKNDDLS